MDKRECLAAIAEELAHKPFHGSIMRLKPNIQPLVDHFPRGRLEEFDGKWCAAFVYHCCVLAGFDIPPRYPPPVSCSFAGVLAWIEWAKLSAHRFYFSRSSAIQPERGDLVVFDDVFIHQPHDHIGIVLAVDRDSLSVAEGNVNNLSTVLRRERNRHIRGYIRIPNDYQYVPATAG